MKVKAKRRLFIDGRLIEKGETFDYEGETGKNMEVLDEPQPERKKPGPKPKPRRTPEDLKQSVAPAENGQTPAE